ncbi:hypothetical protein V8C26DRAFT_438609 [Trichoderma gracile]
MSCPSEKLVTAVKTGKPTSLAVCHSENKIFFVHMLSICGHCSRVHPFRTDISGKRNRSDAHLAFFNFLQKAPLLETHGEVQLTDEDGHVKILKGIMNPLEWDMDTIEQPLLLAHACCWGLAQKLEPTFTRAHFYRLMRQVHPIIPRKREVEDEQWRLALFSHRAAAYYSIASSDPTGSSYRTKGSTGLKGLLKRFASLPRELQQIIWRQIPAKFITSYLLAAAETVAVASDSKDKLEVTAPIFSHQPLIPEGLLGRAWLYTTFISILGCRYVQQIHVSKAQPPSGSCALEIDIRRISHLHFTVQEVGISAIQIAYKDGTESDWLGDPEGGWRGSTRGLHLTDLRVWQDDLKVLSLIPHSRENEDSNGHDQPPKTFASRTLWNILPRRTTGDELRLAQSPSIHVPLMHHPGWSLNQYLPFFDDGCHATGMTVYLGYNGTNGIVIHGQKLVHGAGLREGLSMYMPFNHGERIVRLSVLSSEYKHQKGPFLLVETEVKPENHTTTQDVTRRCVFFGPAHLLFAPLRDMNWTSLLPGPAKGDTSVLKGLIVDPLALGEGADFITLGIHVIRTEKEQSYEAQGQASNSIQSIIVPELRPSEGYFDHLTVAELLNVKELAVQKTSRTESLRPRCTGLIICYLDGSKAVLGQWDVSASSTIIYDAANGTPLTSLLFQKGPSGIGDGRGYMVDIVANTSEEAYHAQSSQEEVDFDLAPEWADSAFEWQASRSESVCWIFGERTDFVRYCQLEELEIQPRKSIPYAEQLYSSYDVETEHFKVKMSDTVILIGPEGSGKSTIGKIIADALSRELYSLDRHRDELYAPYGYDKAFAEEIYKEQGLWAFYQHWKTFEYKAVTHILQNAKQEGDEFYGKILDFGAGHSVFENPEELAHIEALMQPYENVFLVLPCEDVDEVVRITEERRGHELGLNRHFVEHPSNKRLAKHIIYTKDMTAEECAEKVLRIVKSREEV